ncbi:MAG: SDR family oxidoreductase [Cyclobacteriaceae bacterium]
MRDSKNVLITGTSTGIGLDCARVFLKNGFRVYGSVRKAEHANRLQKLLGEHFTPLIFDVTDHEAIDNCAKYMGEELKNDGLACLINNAGIAVSGPLLHLPMDQMRTQFEVNVFGLLKVTPAFAPLLGAKENHPVRPGKIINISSIAGKVAMPFIGPYVSSKHAVEGISGAMRREFMMFGIDVIIVGPGAIKTPIWNKTTEKEMAPYIDTPFAKALLRFQNIFVKDAIKNGFESDFLAEGIFRVFKKRKPKVRYSFVPQPFKNSFVPRNFPPRFLDNFIGKALGLLKKDNR